MKTIYNKKILAEHSFNLEGLGYTTVYITESKQGDYNDIHIVDQAFKQEELNTLNQQIPKENMRDYYLTKEWAHCQAIKKQLWYLYSTNDNVKSFHVEVYEDK